MRIPSVRALLPAAALLALGGCAGNLPENSTAAAPSTTTAVVTTAPVLTGTLLAPPGTVTYAPAYPPATYPQVVYPPQVASTVQTVAIPARLTGGEIASLLSDNTASGVASNGQPYYVYFSHDGRARFREVTYNDSGSWRVLGDRLCTTMTKINVGAEQCYTLYRDGTNVAFERDGARLGSFSVLAGDPQNL
jgi:hypothetical protein